MQYIERTIQLRTAIIARPDILETIRSIFDSHIAEDNTHEPIGKGNTRYAYEVGECEVAPGTKISLLLKLGKTLHSKPSYSMKYSRVENQYRCELGAFETYYDFIAEHIPAVSFQSDAQYEQYCDGYECPYNVERTFSLADDWGGTRVLQGDMGAVPYFNMVVRYQDWFGQLTEGNPPFIKPKNTASHFNSNGGPSSDDYTVEDGRIIDLGMAQCILISVDQGAVFLVDDDKYQDNLGVRLRGEKYFLPENRLDI